MTKVLLKQGTLLCCAFILTLWTFFSTCTYADVNYHVKSGDTLWGLGRTYHASVRSIQSANHMTSDLLHVNQQIVIPTKKNHRGQNISDKSAARSRTLVHRVVSGDSLWNIASRNNMTVEQLMFVNNLYDDTIYPGQELVVDARLAKKMMNSIEVKRAIHEGIPKNLIPVYKGAARTYGVPWTVLAAIHHTETHCSTGYNVSPAGALGPMQFMPSTFATFAVRAPGNHGVPDINNVYDAIFTAAHMLKEEGYAKDPIHAIYAYNHSMYYVQSVRSFAKDI